MLVIWLLAAYMIGSLAIGKWVCAVHGVDIFAIGSGKMGATNVKRALGTGWWFFTLCLDAAKGSVAAAGAFLLGGNVHWAIGAGACAIIGHTYSIFVRFKGGRGAATTLGVLLVVEPVNGLIVLIVWSLILAIVDVVSIATITASAALILLSWTHPSDTVVSWIMTAIAVFVIVAHRENIKRIINGTEPKFRAKEKGEKTNESRLSGSSNEV